MFTVPDGIFVIKEETVELQNSNGLLMSLQLPHRTAVFIHRITMRDMNYSRPIIITDYGKDYCVLNSVGLQIKTNQMEVVWKML